jgi:hypothetical protein
MLQQNAHTTIKGSGMAELPISIVFVLIFVIKCMLFVHHCKLNGTQLQMQLQIESKLQHSIYYRICFGFTLTLTKYVIPRGICERDHNWIC